MSDAKKAILARRAKFVAAALAGITVACDSSSNPFVCLRVAPPSTDGDVPAPQPCLTATAPPPQVLVPDASVVDVDAGTADAGKTDAGKPRGKK